MIAIFLTPVLYNQLLVEEYRDRVAESVLSTLIEADLESIRKLRVWSSGVHPKDGIWKNALNLKGSLEGEPNRWGVELGAGHSGFYEKPRLWDGLCSMLFFYYRWPSFTGTV